MKKEGTVMNFPGILVAILTLGITALIVYAGLSGKKILFMEGPRSAAITLGAIGMVFCTISVGRFISGAPAHPLSIIGYLFGTIALLAFLTQVFQWKISVLQDPSTALWVIAVCIAVKTLVGRLYFLVR
jgi:EamA domain-containing membrane protein RarD